MRYVANSFSLQMLDTDNVYIITVKPATDDDFNEFKGAISCVGHQDTAAVYRSILHWNIRPNRINVKLYSGDKVLVGQLIGGRLPEGATTLPEGCEIKWLVVTIN